MEQPSLLDEGDPARGHLVASCDGSSLGNPGPGGWCWYVNDHQWAAGGHQDTTNNRMELTAVLDILQVTETSRATLELRCDSRYVIDALTKWIHGWKKRGWTTASGGPVANRDLIEDIHNRLTGRDVTFTWVRGHDGDDGNEAADLRARGAAEAVKYGTQVDTGPGLA
jgi:ribonuclease HI